MKYLKNILITGLILFGSLTLQGDPVLDVRGTPTINNFSRYARTSIHLRKTLFEPGEPIPIRFRIRNRGYTTMRLFPSFDTLKSFQFLITDKAGREIHALVGSEIGNSRERGEPVTNMQGQLVKEIILHPGESFEKNIDLSGIYNFKPGQEYRIVGYFYPDYRNGYFVRTANLSRIRLSAKRESEFHTRTARGGMEERLPGLAPEEIVYLFLSAEKRRNWSNYLKYLNLRKFIQSYDRFASRFIMASRLEKPVILREFEKYLIGEPADRLKSFQITGKEFARTGAGEIKSRDRVQVKVRVERQSKGYQILYNYVYSLERVRDRPGFWKIIYVTVNIIK